MTLTIELTAEEEARLLLRAQAAGVDPVAYVRQAIIAGAQVGAPKLSPTELRQRLDALAHAHAPAPVLSDEELRREHIYEEDRAA